MPDPIINPWTKPEKKEYTKEGNRVKYLSELHVPGTFEVEDVPESFVSREEWEAESNRTPWQMSSEEMFSGKKQQLARANKRQLDSTSIPGMLARQVPGADLEMWGDAFSTIFDGFSWIQNKVRQSGPMHTVREQYENTYSNHQKVQDEIQNAKAAGQIGDSLSWFKSQMALSGVAANQSLSVSDISPMLTTTDIVDPVSGERIVSDIATMVEIGLIPAIGDGYLDSINNKYKTVTGTQQAILAEEAQPILNQIILGALIDPTTYAGAGVAGAVIKPNTWKNAYKLAAAGGAKIQTSSLEAIAAFKKLGMQDIVEYHPIAGGTGTPPKKTPTRPKSTKVSPAKNVATSTTDEIAGQQLEEAQEVVDSTLANASDDSIELTAAQEFKSIERQLETQQYDIFDDVKSPSKQKVEAEVDRLIERRNELLDELETPYLSKVSPEELSEKQHLITQAYAGLRNWRGDPDRTPNEIVNEAKGYVREILDIVDNDTGLALRFGVDIEIITDAIKSFDEIKVSDYTGRAGMNQSTYDDLKAGAFDDIQEALQHISTPRHITPDDLKTQAKVNDLAERQLKTPDPEMPDDSGLLLDDGKLATPLKLDLGNDSSGNLIGKFTKVATAGDAAIYRGGILAGSKGYIKWVVIGARKSGGEDGFDTPIIFAQKDKPTMETVEKLLGKDGDVIEWHPSAMTGRRGGGKRRAKWTESGWDNPKYDETTKLDKFKKLREHGTIPKKQVPMAEMNALTNPATRHLNITNTIESFSDMSPPTGEGLVLAGGMIKRSSEVAPRNMHVVSGHQVNGPLRKEKSKLESDVQKFIVDQRPEAEQKRIEIFKNSKIVDGVIQHSTDEVVVVVNRDHPFGEMLTIPNDIELYDIENNIILSGADEYISLLMADPNQIVLFKDEVNPRAVLNAAYNLLGEDNMTNAIMSDPIRAMRAFDDMDRSNAELADHIVAQFKKYHEASTEQRTAYALKRKSYDTRLYGSFDFKAMVQELSANPKYHAQVRELIGQHKTVAVNRLKNLKKYLDLYDNTVFEVGSKNPVRLFLSNMWKGKPQIDVPEGVIRQEYFMDNLDIVSPDNYKKVKEIATEDEIEKILQGADINNVDKWTDEEVARVSERMELYIRGLLPSNMSDEAKEVQGVLGSIGHKAGVGGITHLDGPAGTAISRVIKSGLENGESNNAIKDIYKSPDIIPGHNISMDGQLALFTDGVELGIWKPWYEKTSLDDMILDLSTATRDDRDLHLMRLNLGMPTMEYTSKSEMLESMVAKTKEFLRQLRERGMSPEDYPTEPQSLEDLMKWVTDMEAGEPPRMPPKLFIDFGDDVPPNPRHMGTFKRLWLGIQKYMTDRGVYINYWSTQADAMHMDIHGEHLAARDKAEVTAALTRGSANSAMYKVRPVYKAIDDLYGQTNGEYTTYMEYENALNEYMVLRQEYDIMTSTDPVTGKLRFPNRKLAGINKKTGKPDSIGPDGVRELLAGYEVNPNINILQTAARQVTTLYNRQLWKLVDNGIVSPDFAVSLEKHYREYIPLQLVQDHILDQYTANKKVRVWQGQDPIKELGKYGAKDRHVRPLDELHHNIMNLEFYANYNKTVDNLVDHLYHYGQLTGKHIVEEVKINRDGDLLTSKGILKDDTHQIVKFRSDNKWQAWRIPKEEAYALDTLLNHNGGNMVQRVFRDWINRPLKWAFVHYNPGFLVYQFMFDMVNVGFQHGIPGIADSMANLFRPLSKDPLMQQLMQEGGAVGYWRQVDTELKDGQMTGRAKDVVNKMFGMKSAEGKGTGMPIKHMPTRNVHELTTLTDLKTMARHPLTTWQRLANHVEMAPRKAAGRRVFKKGGGMLDEKGNIVSGDVQDAALAMRRVTGDFSRGGLATKALDDFFAFANIAVQGGLIPARALKHNPTMFFSALATGITANAALFAYNMQYDEYSDVPIDYRMGPILMLPSDPQDINPYTGKPNPRFIRLLPGSLREWMAIFGTQNYIMGEMYNTNPEAFSAFLNEQLLEGTPIGTFYGADGGMKYPGLITGKIHEAATNKSTWSGQQIVPDHLAHLPLEQQVNSATTQTAIAVSRVIPYSPMKIQHFMNIPGISGTVGAVDIAINAASYNSDSKSVNDAEEILELMRTQTDEVGAKKVRDQYLSRNVEVERRREVMRVLARITNGKSVQHGDAFVQAISNPSQLPFISQFTNRVYHSHGGSLERTIKERAQKKLGVNKDAQQRVNRRLSELFNLVDEREWMAHSRYEESGNTKQWKQERDDIQTMIFGVYETINQASEYDGSLQDRDQFSDADIAQYYQDINKASVAFGGEDLKIKTHVAGWKAIKPTEKEDGTIDWHTYFRKRSQYMENLKEDYGQEFVTEFEEVITSTMNPTELLYDKRLKEYIRPYFEDSETAVLDRYRQAGYSKYVTKWLEVQTWSDRQRAQYEQTEAQEAHIVSSIDSAMIAERQRRRWSDGDLEAILVMYNYTTTPRTEKGMRVFKNLALIESQQIQQNLTSQG